MRIDGALLDAALALVKEYDIDFASVPDDALRALVINSELPGIARVDALELYSARKPADLPVIVRQLAVGEDDACAIAALRMLAESDPQAALASAEKTIKAPGAWRQQQAWRIVAGIALPGAADLIAGGLEGLSKTKGVSPAALELLDIAAQRKEPVVQNALAAFQSEQGASTDPLAKWLTLLEGGDSKRGGELFGSHPAGQCMRCHAVGHGGGDAGPDLSDIGGRVDRRHLLEALVVPGAKVAAGYGIASATLKSGKTLGGIVLAETPEHVDFDSAGTPMRAARADIQTMTPPVSSMPPMGFILQPGEIRDIVAWLAEQKAKAKKKPKRPNPVLVK
jgi:quinoprotein glucose dehydrogenase